ncbi:MAG: polymerase [Phycisphaerales bacterium]|nr:polymerase [Phycisphaerales bacterium]
MTTSGNTMVGTDGGPRSVPDGGLGAAGGRTSAREDGGPVHAIAPVRPVPIGLTEDVRRASAAALNQLLADTITLRDLYKKHHWQVGGPTFYQLHLLFDKHYAEQAALVDAIAERIRILGGVSVAMAHDVAELTRIPRPPIGREPPPAQIARLLRAHEAVLVAARASAREAADRGDDGTNDLLVSSVVRTNEMQVWFAGEHLEHLPLLPEPGSDGR